SSPSSTIPGSSAQYHLCSPLGKSPVTTKNSSLYLLTSTVAPTLIRKLLPSLGAVSNVFHSGRAEAYANLIKSSMLHFSISARTNPLACAHHSLKSVIFHPPYIIRYSSVPFQCLPLGISSKLFIFNVLCGCIQCSIPRRCSNVAHSTQDYLVFSAFGAHENFLYFPPLIKVFHFYTSVTILLIRSCSVALGLNPPKNSINLTRCFLS